MNKSPQKIGFQETLNWYENNAKNYAQKIADKPDLYLMNRFLREVAKGEKILDAGCAAGRDCELFAERGYEPTGIDAAKALIKEAKSNNPNLNFIHGDFTDLPFADNSFAGVWAHASLLHFEKTSEVKAALKEFHRVLKKDGVAHIFVKKQLGSEKTSNIAQDYSGDFNRFFRWFTKDELKKLVEQAGFTIINFDDNYTPKDGRKNIKWLAVLAKKG